MMELVPNLGKELVECLEDTDRIEDELEDVGAMVVTASRSLGSGLVMVTSVVTIAVGVVLPFLDGGLRSSSESETSSGFGTLDLRC